MTQLPRCDKCDKPTKSHVVGEKQRMEMLPSARGILMVPVKESIYRCHGCWEKEPVMCPPPVPALERVEEELQGGIVNGDRATEHG